jgi:hypothetical protein
MPSVSCHRPARVRGWLRALALGLAVVALAGCREPVAGPDGDGTVAAEEPLASVTPDPRRDALIASFGDLTASVTTARDALAEAAEATTTTAATAAANDALAALVVDATGTAPQTRPLFPAETVDRSTATAVEDQLTLTASIARDAGTAGRELLHVLRDPIAGDLGAWQRDAAGVLASISEATTGATSLDDLDAAIAELPGLGTRAIAYAQLVTRASSTEAAVAFAERGAAHLEVILATLERVELEPE